MPNGRPFNRVSMATREREAEACCVESLVVVCLYCMFMLPLADSKDNHPAYKGLMIK
jgi:hypothetical protein